MTQLSTLCLATALSALRTWAQELLPIGTAVNPYGSTEIEQMAYDPASEALYLANGANHTIVKAPHISVAPLEPSAAASWPYAVVAGVSGQPGGPGLAELHPDVATFRSPTGVAGWPQYAIGPSPTAGTAGMSWAGLWVADFGNYALRFVNCKRGGNVTLVAGSSAGAVDGIGAAASLGNPRNVVWDRFPIAALGSEGVAGTPLAASAWTTVVYWTDYSHHCMRQGVPMHNDTAHSQFGSSTTAADLGDMVLNVTAFAGLCDSAYWGTYADPLGLVHQALKMFSSPWGVALMHTDPLTAASAWPGGAVMFVGDHIRLSMVAPMYPSSARFLAAITAGDYTGVTVARTHTGPLIGDEATVSVELFVGEHLRRLLNVSAVFTMNRNGTAALATASTSVLATLAIQETFNVALVRYAPNHTFNATLIVFGGWTGGSTTSTDALQFYCCVSVEYSEFHTIGRSTSVTRSVSRTSVKRQQYPLSATATKNCTSSWSSMQGRTKSNAITVITTRSVTYPVHILEILLRSKTSTKHSLTFSRTRSSITVLVQHRQTTPRTNASLIAQLSMSGGVSRTPVAAAITAAVATSGLVSTAASKAAVSGKTMAVWSCSSVGPAQAAANDPQQFLSFGARLGNGPDGGTRGALLLTSYLRALMFILLMIVVLFRKTICVESDA